MGHVLMMVWGVKTNNLDIKTKQLLITGWEDPMHTALDDMRGFRIAHQCLN